MADDDDDANGDGEESEGTTTWDIKSEAIASLAYDNRRGVAIFTFHKGGKTYTAPISIQQATAWAHSDSPGEYFNENIKGMYGAPR